MPELAAGAGRGWVGSAPAPGAPRGQAGAAGTPWQRRDLLQPERGLGTWVVVARASSSPGVAPSPAQGLGEPWLVTSCHRERHVWGIDSSRVCPEGGGPWPRSWEHPWGCPKPGEVQPCTRVGCAARSELKKLRHGMGNAPTTLAEGISLEQGESARKVMGQGGAVGVTSSRSSALAACPRLGFALLQPHPDGPQLSLPPRALPRAAAAAGDGRGRGSTAGVQTPSIPASIPAPCKGIHRGRSHGPRHPYWEPHRSVLGTPPVRTGTLRPRFGLVALLAEAGSPARLPAHGVSLCPCLARVSSDLICFVPFN